MMSPKKILLIIFLSLIALSCSKSKIIPTKTMSRIYYDIYLTDQRLQFDKSLARLSDSLLVYEPIFNKYGYTSGDYTNSVNYYLQNPKEFVSVFEETNKLLVELKDSLLIVVRDLKQIKESWPTLDSLSALASDSVISNPYYRSLNIIFFKPDVIVISSPIIDSTIYEHKYNSYQLYNSSPFISEGDVVFDSTAPLSSGSATRVNTIHKTPLQQEIKKKVSKE